MERTASTATLASLLRAGAVGAVAMTLLASAPAAASPVVTLTFTGVTGDGGFSAPWGFDAFGNNIVGDPYSVKATFDLSKGTTQHFGGEEAFTASGGASATFTVNGHTYDVTGSTAAVYVRTTSSIELIFYDDVNANTGLVLYAPLTNTASISKSLGGSIPTLTLAPPDVALSGENVVLPLGGGALYAVENVTTLAVAGVPEPATWAIMLVGFGLTGGALRANQRTRLSRSA